MMELTECPECGSKEIWIYEYYQMFQRYPPEAVDTREYDDEHWLSGDCLTFTCEKCEHEWASEDATEITDLLPAVARVVQLETETGR